MRQATAAAMTGLRTRLRRETGAMTRPEISVIGSTIRPASVSLSPRTASIHWVIPYSTTYRHSMARPKRRYVRVSALLDASIRTSRKGAPARSSRNTSPVHAAAEMPSRYQCATGSPNRNRSSAIIARANPAKKTRRGPSTSAALPAVGCAMAVARYSAVTSAAVCPTGTPIPRAIGSRAVAISELLTGLRAEPIYSGVVNCHGNGRPRGVAAWLAAPEERASGGADMVAPVTCLPGQRSQQVGEALDQGRRGREHVGLLAGECLLEDGDD